MPIAVLCPECGKAYQLPEESLGRKASCKKCGFTFRVQPVDATQSSRSGSESSGTRGRNTSSDTLPLQIGRFQILAKLGSGAFGTVYRAHDPVLEREVAVKVPNPGLLSSERDKQRYLREPKAAGQLHHPNIVPVFEASLDGDNIFIVSAFIKGQTLEKAIEEKRPDLRRAATLVMKLARALQYAHDNGIVHRDVKPANIMLDSKGEPLLMDFGLARIQESAEKLTMNEAVLGTPAYMSPEQATHKNEEVGPASDQYSLGVVLYEMLCGQRPFSGPAAMVMSLVMEQEPPAPRSLNPKLPRDLETICLKAMAKEPKKRFVDCQDLAEDLERWLKDEPITARRTTFVERGIRWCRRNPLVAGLTSSVGALLFLVAVISTLAAFRLEQEKQRTEEKAKEALTQRQLADVNASEAIKQQKLADTNAAEAISQKQIAEASSAKATEQARLAEMKANEAKQQKEIADREREKNIEESRRAYRKHYFTQMDFARTDWESGDIGSVLKRLDQSRPQQTGGIDFRGFEWHYWNNRCQTESSIFAKTVAFALSPDGRTIATIGNLTITLFDSTNFKEITTIKTASPLRAIAYSPDGNLIAGGDFSGILHFWDATGKSVFDLDLKSGALKSIAYNPKGTQLAAVGSSDETGQTHDLIVLQVNADSTAHITSSLQRLPWLGPNPAAEIVYSPDGRHIVSSRDHALRIPSTGALVRRLETGGASFCLAYSHDGTQVALGSRDATGAHVVILQESSTGKVIRTLTGHKAVIVKVSFSRDGGRLMSSSRDNTIRTWNTKTGSELHTIRDIVTSGALVAFSSDGTRIFSGSEDRIKVWDALYAQETLTIKTPESHERFEKVSFGPDANTVLSASYSGIKVWDLKTRRHQFQFTDRGLDTRGKNVAFSQNGLCIAAGRFKVRGWDAATGNETINFSKVNGNNTEELTDILSVASSPDGRFMATAHVGGAVKLRNWAKKQETVMLHADQPPFVKSLAFTPDGRQLLSADTRTIKFWDVETGEETHSIKTENRVGNICIAISSDGKRIASCSQGTVIVWDVESGRETLVYHGHNGPIHCVAFSPDGTRIVTAGNTIKLWDSVSGEDCLLLTEHTAAVHSVAFSSDGRRIVSGSEDGTIKIWDATDKE